MTIEINDTVVVNSDRSITLGTATPGSPVAGMIRYNSGLTQFEYYDGVAWTPFVRESGGLLAWGSDTQGTLGVGTVAVEVSYPVSIAGAITSWCEISCSSMSLHTLAIRTNGTAWGWGRNCCGAVGDGTTTLRCSPVQVAGGFTDWRQVSSNGCHSVGFRANGTAYAWGLNGDGQLGDGTTVDKSSPVLVSGGFTDWVQVSAGWDGFSLGIRANGTAYAWGLNGDGQLGDGTTVDKSSPVLIDGSFADWVQVSAGDQHSVGLRANGTLWSWGCNWPGSTSLFGTGILGDGTTVQYRNSPVLVIGGYTDWCQVSTGFRHTLAIRTNGSAWGWGRNFLGSLGDGTETFRSSPVSVIGGITDWVQVSAGVNHNLALRANGTAYAWGDAESGQLGDGTTVDKSSPVLVSGGHTDWVQVTAGSRRSFGNRG